MNIFSLSQEIAIDLGTANTIITCNGKIVVDEPSIVAIDVRTDKLIAIGREAQKMHERTHERIRTIRPLKDGVIANFNAAELMIRGMIKMIPKQGKFFKPSLKMVIGIPSGSTEVEIRAVRDSAEQAGGREIFLIYEPMAAALGIGLDIEAPEGNMVVDIGGGTTEIAVISLGGLVADRSLKIAGDGFTQDIKDYMSSVHNMKIGEKTAEQIKMNVGSAMIALPKDEEPEIYRVTGPHRSSSLPTETSVKYSEVAHALDKSISRIENAILSALDTTPPEIYSDLVKNGIYLAGGGALLRGLAQRLFNKIQIPFHVADDPLRAVARGTGIALKNTNKFQFLLR
ncbi:MAG: rod shape-determining protein [Prevotellaceae bacterium]|jgi:rod shape-determining protein MreB|nr:rod shape-determining protein [Prevotellaceae bacterium]